MKTIQNHQIKKIKAKKFNFSKKTQHAHKDKRDLHVKNKTKKNNKI